MLGRSRNADPRQRLPRCKGQQDQTLKQCGTLVKYRKALKLVCDLPSKEKSLLMEPPEWVARLPEEGTMTVGFIKLLQKCFAVYMPNEEEMWCR